MIKRIHHVQITIPKGAEAIARTFYCDQLQFEEIEKPDTLKHRGGLWLKLGEQEIHIGTEDDIDRNRTKAHIAYEVQHINNWRSQLIKSGITIIESIPIPGYQRFECRDPFGNRIEIIEPL